MRVGSVKRRVDKTKGQQFVSPVALVSKPCLGNLTGRTRKATGTTDPGMWPWQGGKAPVRLPSSLFSLVARTVVTEEAWGTPLGDIPLGNVPVGDAQLAKATKPSYLLV